MTVSEFLESIPKEVRKFIRNKNIATNIFRLQAYDLTKCEYVCIGFINFMLKSKTLLNDTHLFSPTEYKKNDKMTK